jgi:hypothetical protein
VEVYDSLTFDALEVLVFFELLLTVSSEMLGMVFLTFRQSISADGWSFESISASYTALRCGVLLRPASRHPARKALILSAHLPAFLPLPVLSINSPGYSGSPVL